MTIAEAQIRKVSRCLFITLTHVNTTFPPAGATHRRPNTFTPNQPDQTERTARVEGLYDGFRPAAIGENRVYPGCEQANSGKTQVFTIKQRSTPKNPPRRHGG